MSLYTEAPRVYCNGPGCCTMHELPAHWEYKLDAEWTCPNGHVLHLTDEYAVRHWTWRRIDETHGNSVSDSGDTK